MRGHVYIVEVTKGHCNQWAPVNNFFVLRSEYVLWGMGRIVQQWQQQQWQRQQWLTPKTQLSNVDLGIRLVEMLEGQADSETFAKLGPRVRVDEAVMAEELALEALCSQPLQEGGGGGWQGDKRQHVEREAKGNS